MRAFVLTRRQAWLRSPRSKFDGVTRPLRKARSPRARPAVDSVTVYSRTLWRELYAQEPARGHVGVRPVGHPRRLLFQVERGESASAEPARLGEPPRTSP